MLHPGDIVLVPFPFSEGKGHKWRPALVISTPVFHKKYGMCWAAMITSADNPPWPKDIAISPLKNTGLTAPSVIRPAKIASLQIDKARKIGKVAPEYLEETVEFIENQLPVTS